MINSTGCLADPRIRPNKGQIVTLEAHSSFSSIARGQVAAHLHGPQKRDAEDRRL